MLPPRQNNTFAYSPGNVDTILYRDDNVDTSTIEHTKLPNSSRASSRMGHKSYVFFSIHLVEKIQISQLIRIDYRIDYQT